MEKVSEKVRRRLYRHGVVGAYPVDSRRKNALRRVISDLQMMRMRAAERGDKEAVDDIQASIKIVEAYLVG